MANDTPSYCGVCNNIGRCTCSTAVKTDTFGASTRPVSPQETFGKYDPSIMVPSNGSHVHTFTDPNVVNPWDNQVGGQHYKQGIQPFEYAMANNLSSLEFSVVKYLRKKGDKAKRLEDLNKAKDCLEKLIWWEEHDGKI